MVSGCHEDSKRQHCAWHPASTAYVSDGHRALPDGQELTSLDLSPAQELALGFTSPVKPKQKQKRSAPPAPQRHLLYSFTPCKDTMEHLLAEGAVQGGDLPSRSLTHSTWAISPPPRVALTPPPPLSGHQPSFCSTDPFPTSWPLHMLFQVPAVLIHALLLLILQTKYHLSQGPSLRVLSYSGPPSGQWLHLEATSLVYVLISCLQTESTAERCS